MIRNRDEQIPENIDLAGILAFALDTIVVRRGPYRTPGYVPSADVHVIAKHDFAFACQFVRPAFERGRAYAVDAITAGTVLITNGDCVMSFTREEAQDHFHFFGGSLSSFFDSGRNCN